jgi:hypothetical protein
MVRLDEVRSAFSRRTPVRPNEIGLTIVAPPDRTLFKPPAQAGDFQVGDASP